MPWPVPYPEVGKCLENYDPNSRYATVFMYFRNSPTDNTYAHALDFNAIVDLYRKKVVKIIECRPGNNGKVPLPHEESNYDEKEFKGTFREDLKTLQVL